MYFRFTLFKSADLSFLIKPQKSIKAVILRKKFFFSLDRANISTTIMILKVIKNAFSYLKIWNHYTKTICKVIIRFKRVQKLSKFHHFRTIFELFLNLTFYPAQFYTISSKVVFFVNRKYDQIGVRNHHKCDQGAMLY